MLWPLRTWFEECRNVDFGGMASGCEIGFMFDEHSP
jgi:hypothetical protein